MDSSDRCAVKRCIQLTPLTCGDNRPCCNAHGLKHASNDHGIGWKHFAQQRDGWLIRTPCSGCLNWTGQNFFARIFQHRTGQHIFGFSVRWHTKTGYINTDNANPVDIFGQQLQRYTTCSWYAQVDDHYGVIFFWIRFVVDRLTNVFKQLTCDQRFRVKRYITHAAFSTVKV